MSGRWGVLATCVCVTLLTGCGRLFMSPRPQEAYEKQQPRMARAEADRVDRYARQRQRQGASVEEILADADRMTRLGQIDRAVMGYIDALQADPESLVPRARIANLQLSRDPERAETLFRQMVADHPDLAMAHAGLGLSLLARNRVEDAEAPLRRAVAIDPSLANAHTALSVVYDLQGRHDLAQQYALRASELKPRDATIANNLGVSYLISGDYPAAERAFRAAALMDPSDPAIRNNLGVALGRQGRYDEALDQFLKNGTQQAAYNNLGYVYLLEGQIDEAIVQFEIALQQEGDEKLVVLRNLNAALDARDRGMPAAPDRDR